MSGIYRGPNSSVAAQFTNADGDKGDIVVSNSGALWTIDAEVVDSSKVSSIDASKINNTPSGNLAATNVQTALNELQADIDTRLSGTALSTHINLAVDAHDASAISVVPTGNLSSSTVQLALQELQGDIDGRALSGSILSSGITQSTAKILGRTTAGIGAVEEISIGAGLSLSAGTLIGTSLSDGDKGDITISGGGTTFTIDNGVVTPAKMSNDAKTNKIQPISSSVAANALTITLNPTTLDFRSSTLSSGTVNTRNIPTAISLTISSGSTLGTVNAVQSRIVVLAIDNAGTVELAAVNIAGGNQLDETNLITTVAEGGAGAADSANVIYSTTARTNVPYRVVGYVESTQATAGTWATAPSTIQGYGGQALAAMSSYGNAIPVDVTGSRTTGNTYYNTRSRPINVTIRSILPNTGTLALTVNGVSKQRFSNGNAGAAEFSVSDVVGPGQSYSNTGNTAHTQWVET